MQRFDDDPRRRRVALPGDHHADDAPSGPTRAATGPTATIGNGQTKARYGILGGTFDPPHIGHLIMAQEAYARLGLDRVWFVPAGAPPHKAGHVVSDAADRVAMVELAIAPDSRFGCLTVEVDRRGPSYTVDTLSDLRSMWGAAVELFFVLGWDMLLFLPHWHDPAGVLAALDGLVAVHRPGFDTEPQALTQLKEQFPTLREKLILLPMPQVAFSSSDIRERVACGLPIRYLVPDTVDQYIGQHGLYRAQVKQPAQDGERQERREEEPA